MQFYQHIYGRVSRGYRGRDEGYQVAAMSNELASWPQLVEKLSRYSFFEKYPGEGNPVRYSFFCPGDGFLAFGAA